MKLQQYLKLFATAIVLSMIPSIVHSEDALPAIIPNPPPSSKPVSEYTAADVLSLSSVETKFLNANHPYLAEPKYSKVLARDWLGRKDPQKIDQLVAFILLSPGRGDDASDLRGDLENNVAYIINEIMDVRREEKADALLRVIANETDPVKKTLARHFACEMFKVLLDPRLIQPMRAEFTNPETWDDTEYTELNPDDYAAGLSDEPQTMSAKSEAVDMITAALGYVGIDFDGATYFTSDDDADCLRLGQWLDANVKVINKKCQEARNADKFMPWSEYCIEWAPR
jgi:hypothetical protein